ncbi:MAG TPA: flagellar biosynthetic protein FliR [Solimonas sp.]|nr:flagellar biosynthetic protein FliR [Solimonas sp.]
MTVTDTQLLAWVQQYLWPFLRIGGLLMIAPVLGARTVAPRIRIALAALLTLMVAPLLPPAEPLAMFTAAWWVCLTQQLLIGLCMGFVLQLAFEALLLGGELIAYSMGLSFAQLADPLRGASTPVVGQFLTIWATLLFLSLDGHLGLIELLFKSFQTLPVSGPGLGTVELERLLRYSGSLFAGGLSLALPVVIALLVVNLAMGVIGRAAPTLNLFAVGFPVTLTAGLLLLRASLPSLGESFERLLAQALELVSVLIGA